MPECPADSDERLTAVIELLEGRRDGRSREHLLWGVDQMMSRVKPGDLTDKELLTLVMLLAPAHARALVAEKAFARGLLGAVAPAVGPALSLVPRAEPPADLM
jgi:hypothetical protein